MIDYDKLQVFALLGKGQRAAVSQTVERIDGGAILQLAFCNRSDRSASLKELCWEYCGDRDASLHMAPEAVAVYLEGWQMATPCGVRRYGERDFEFDPDYLRFAVPNPEDCSGERNCFRAECMTAIRNGQTGNILLAGFITSAEAYGCFRIGVFLHKAREKAKRSRYARFSVGKTRKIGAAEEKMGKRFFKAAPKASWGASRSPSPLRQVQRTCTCSLREPFQRKREVPIASAASSAFKTRSGVISPASWKTL